MLISYKFVEPLQKCQEFTKFLYRFSIIPYTFSTKENKFYSISTKRSSLFYKLSWMYMLFSCTAILWHVSDSSKGKRRFCNCQIELLQMLLSWSLNGVCCKCVFSMWSSFGVWIFAPLGATRVTYGAKKQTL